ncbi:hypothetical protein B0H34DRAFT_645622 [Crassisporium funariophilum]|nr:hypothetical protein B0H34DRAFT_645622 [Crassisporium funariophilum]
MGWQHTFTLAKRAKGCHLVTDEVVGHIRPGLEGVKASVIQHTSAALTVNENYDRDMDMALDNIVPESLDWQHTDEGPECVTSFSHTKASLVGSSISIPVTDGKLNLGTWQGIYLTEFRHLAHTRRVVATIMYELLRNYEVNT